LEDHVLKRVLSKTLACLAVSASLSLSLAATPGPPLPEGFSAHLLPSTTQLYVELNPKVSFHEGEPLLARLRRSPLLRVMGRAANMAGIELQDLSAWPILNGRVLMALTRTGSLSPFEHMERLRQARERLSELRAAAEAAFEGINQYRRYQKKFPRSVEDLATHGYFEPEMIPVGAELQLQRRGSQMSVVARQEVAGEGPLEVVWPARESAAPAAVPEWGGLMVALGCSDHGNVARWLDKLDPELDFLARDGDHWRLDSALGAFEVVLARNWIVVCNRGELTNALLTSTPPAAGLPSNPRFAAHSPRFAAASELLGFFDLQDFAASSPGLASRAGLDPERSGLRSVSMHSWSALDGQRRLQAHGEMFLHWEGLTPVVSSQTEGARGIPEGCESVYWVDLGASLQLVEQVANRFNGLPQMLEMSWAQVEALFSSALSRKSLAQGGQATFYSESIDSLAMQLEMLMEIFQTYAELGKGSDGPPAPPGWTQFPLVVAFSLDNKEASAAVVEHLEKMLGEARSQRNQGAETRVGMQDRCSLTVVKSTPPLRKLEGEEADAPLPAAAPNLVIWSNGSTQRLVPPLLKVRQGQLGSLDQLGSYQRFQQQSAGTPLAMFHLKSDKDYALIKALLLMLGSDFRPEAEVYGRIRDGYAALEQIPNGLLLRSSLFSEGEQPLPPPATEE